MALVAAGFIFVGFNSGDFGRVGTSSQLSRNLATACNRAVARAKDYGVLPASAEPASDSAAPGTEKGRSLCRAKAGLNEYSIVIDFRCNDGSSDSCFRLLRVTDSNGSALFDRAL